MGNSKSKKEEEKEEKEEKEEEKEEKEMSNDMKFVFRSAKLMTLISNFLDTKSLTGLEPTASQMREIASSDVVWRGKQTNKQTHTHTHTNTHTYT